MATKALEAYDRAWDITRSRFISYGLTGMGIGIGLSAFFFRRELYVYIFLTIRAGFYLIIIMIMIIIIFWYRTCMAGLPCHWDESRGSLCPSQ